MSINNTPPEPKVVLSIRIDVKDNGRFDVKQRCSAGAEQEFAQILSGMCQGTLPEYILNVMKKAAKNKSQKKAIALIEHYLEKYNQDFLAQAMSMMKTNEPVVKPSEVFSTHLKKFRGMK